MQVSLQGMEEFVGWEKATEMPYCSTGEEPGHLSAFSGSQPSCTVACYIKFLLLYKEKQINFNSEKT